MAAEAVLLEPVSASHFPLEREFNGKLRAKWPLWSDSRVDSMSQSGGLMLALAPPQTRNEAGRGRQTMEVNPSRRYVPNQCFLCGEVQRIVSAKSCISAFRVRFLASQRTSVATADHKIAVRKIIKLMSARLTLAPRIHGLVSATLATVAVLQ